MDKSFYRMTDPEFAVWFNNFVNLLETHQAELDLTDEQIAEIKGIRDNFNVALLEKQATDELSKAKNNNLQSNRKSSNDKAGYYSKSFKLEGISASLLKELGLSVDAETITPSGPIAVTDLIVSGFANGINSLRWNKNGNPVNTQFIIEARKESETDFVYSGVTTKTKFEHKNQKPGVRMFYRIKSQKNDVESQYSHEAVVY